MTMDAPQKKKNLGWLWYFAGLAVLTILATAILATFNLRQQLKREQLDAARKLWEQHGPADYVLSYTKNAAGVSTDHFMVKVRAGRAREVLLNGLPLEEERLAYYGMHRLFDDVERFLDIDDDKAAPRTYTRATFDPRNGALWWYVRRVMGTRQRLEITVVSLETK